MIGVDTNVLVRYVTQDDATQAVLRRGYKIDKESIAAVLQRLLEIKEIVVEQADTVRRALRRVGDGADFADALITELGHDAGCERTVTFDQSAVETAGMRLLG